jgi:hypothetical protein
MFFPLFSLFHFFFFFFLHTIWGMINMPNYGSWYGINISELDLYYEN